MNRRINKLAVAVFVACNAGLAAFSAVAAPDDATKNGAIQRALAHLQNNGSSDTFVARDVIIDDDGAQHVRFDRSASGLRVIGGDVVVHSNGNGALVGLSQRASTVRNAHASSRINLPNVAVPANAEAAARNQARALFQGVAQGDVTAETVLYARDREPVLALDILVSGTSIDGSPSETHFIIDAQTNALLDSYDDVRPLVAPGSGFNLKMLTGADAAHGHQPFIGKRAMLESDADVATGSAAPVGIFKLAASGTGKSLLAGTVPLTTDSITGGFALRDPSRGNHYATEMKNRTNGNGTLLTDTDNTWGTFLTTSTQTAAVDAVFGQNLTWDFFMNTLGRNGIANDGRGAFSRVHYGRSYVNAFWSDSCFCMTYGDGDGATYLPLVSIDVAAHEMTHGVTSRSAALVYSGESGGLNEAMSDIFGATVEFVANNAQSVPNYLIGERIFSANLGVATPTRALRYMFKPSIDTRSPDCYVSTIGTLDVHYSSGVANHFYYLLAEGAVTPPGFSTTPAQLVCNGNTALAGIGRDAAIRIVYRALTVYMTSTTNYAGARAATLQAASDLYGGTSAQRNAVAAAWSAVSVN